jgi:microsomal dipeptidase-like Zn-dependent dipeptidase
MARALHQADKLHRFAEHSGGRLTVIRRRSDLDAFLERRRAEKKIVGAFLGLEGAHALDGEIANVDVLFEAGFRMMAPTHFFDNDIGGSAHGVDRGGLSEKGRAMVRRMEEKGMVVDVAHASPRALDDTLQMAKKPVVVSHTGVQGTCDNRRNLTDEHLQAIARTQGVVGIGYWPAAVCGDDAHAVVRAIRYAADRVGVEHVALGSDFDGARMMPFDVTGTALITDALLEAGFTEPHIRLIMGDNVLRVLRSTLPP